MITVLGVLAGAGMANGVTKLVAQHRGNSPAQLRTVVGTSSRDNCGFSLRFAGAELASCWRPVLRTSFRSYGLSGAGASGCALVQMGIAGEHITALMKGFRDASGNALSLIVGAFEHYAALYLCYRVGGYEGASAARRWQLPALR